MTKEQQISNIKTRIELKYDQQHLIAVYEYSGDTLSSYYLANENILNKWSNIEKRYSHIEFDSPISLRVSDHNGITVVNACARGKLTPPPVKRSIESKNGMLRHFTIGNDIIQNWLSRMAC